MARHTAKAERMRENIDHVERLQLAGYTDCHALPSKFVDDVQHPVLATIVRAVLDEVVGPDVIGPPRSEAHARTVVESEARPLGLASRNLEPLASPDALDLLHVDRPAIASEEYRDPTVPVAPVMDGQGDDGGRQSGFVFDQHGAFALSRTMLAQDAASEAL